jgi:hypothetical protein
MNKTEERSDRLHGLGMKFNGSEFFKEDFNVHWTEISCDTDEEFDAKIEKIKAEMRRRKRSKSQIGILLNTEPDDSGQL